MDESKRGRGPFELTAADLADRIVLRDSDFDFSRGAAVITVQGRRFPLIQPVTRFGNSASCDFRVETIAVGCDARIAKQENVYLLEAGNGSTGLLVNGKRMLSEEQKRLADGDVIAIGGEFVYFSDSASDTSRVARVTPIDIGRVSVDRDVVTIGRSTACTIVLGHPTVAMVHARIVSEQTGTSIEALDGRVRVNGALKTRTSLRDGDEISVGPYRIVFAGSDLIERGSPREGLAIAATQLTVAVGDICLLQPVDLTVKPGEMVALIGESGAGKSTLINALAGVINPTSGRVDVGGEPVAQRLADIGFVPQFDNLHQTLTLYEALDYAARLRLPQDTTVLERRRRIAEVLAQLGLLERANVRVGSLSGGQRKRASVGVELLRNPGAVFLDEPTTGLDPGLERQMMLLLRGLADAGQTIVLVTHATSNLGMCDRVVVMGRGGTVKFEGSPNSLIESFGIDSFDEVYTEVLDREPKRRRRLDLSRAFSDDINFAEQSRRSQPGPKALRQIGVLSSRQLKLQTRDRRHLAISFIQVPVLAAVAAMLFPGGVFDHSPAPHAGKSAQLVFLLVMISGWIGSVAAAREIVKERNVVGREFAVGVRVGSYLTAKYAVLLSLITTQTILLCAFVFALQPLESSPAIYAAIIAIVVTTGILGGLLGLIVSAAATSEDQATGLIPLLLVPQLLLAGAIVAVPDMSRPMQLLAGLVPSRWSFAAAGDSLDMHTRIASDDEFSKVSQFGEDFFKLPLTSYTLIGLAFAAIFTIILWFLVRRPRML